MHTEQQSLRKHMEPQMSVREKRKSLLALKESTVTLFSRKGSSIVAPFQVGRGQHLRNLYIIPNFRPGRGSLRKQGRGRTLKAPLVPLRCSTYATFVVAHLQRDARKEEAPQTRSLIRFISSFPTATQSSGHTNVKQHFAEYMIEVGHI